MASKWRKAKIALGLNLCYYVPKPIDDDDDDSSPSGERLSDAALLSRPAPAGSWSSFRLSRNSSRSRSTEVCSPIESPLFFYAPSIIEVYLVIFSPVEIGLSAYTCICKGDGAYT